MTIHTREQRFASGVYQLVSRVVSADEQYRKRYGSMAHTLPILIRSAGLVQALAFVAARPDKPQYRPQLRLLEDLALVLGFSDAAALGTASRTAPLADYLHLTKEALQALLWFKRYAQSVLGVEPDAGEDEV